MQGSKSNLYGYAGDSPSNATDPGGLTAQTNSQFASDWIFETDTPGDWTYTQFNGHAFRYYGQDATETQEMMHSAGMLWVETVYWWYDCQQLNKDINFTTIPAYLTTTENPFSTALEVGAFSTNVQNMPDGTVQYTMYNKAGWHSLLGGLNFGIGDHDRQPSFPMQEMNQYGGNIRQMFQWRGATPCHNPPPPGRK